MLIAAVLKKVKSEPEDTATKFGWVGFLVLPLLVWKAPAQARISLLVFAPVMAGFFSSIQKRLAGSKGFKVDSLARQDAWTRRDFALWWLEVLFAFFMSGTLGLMVSALIWQLKG